MPSESEDQTDSPPQAIRNQFSKAIESNDSIAVSELLAQEPTLANMDLRPVELRDHFTSGLPLFRACQSNNFETAKILLDHSADPSAAGSRLDDQPEYSMPLHFAAVDNKNYQLANLLLDHDANPNGYPYCSQSTIECMFYRAHDEAQKLDWNQILRRVFTKYLPMVATPNDCNLKELIANSESKQLASFNLFVRMIDHGAQLPFVALVRGGFNDLLSEMISHCPDAVGTRHDHPNSNVFNNIFGVSRWYGYPKLHRQIIEAYPERILYDSHIDTINVAISSHNRDGNYQDYREIILMHLELLQSKSMLTKAQNDSAFKPLLKIATDFTWHNNYGYRAEIAKPECYFDLAELFVAWGFKDINFEDAATGHSPLSAAVNRGHHPGISTYVGWLLNNGADLRVHAEDEVNPMKIATENEHSELCQLLEQAKR